MMRFWKSAKAPEIEMFQDVERGYELLPHMTLLKIADLIGRLEAWLEMDMLTPSGHTLLMEARRQYDILSTEAEMLRRGLDPTKPPLD